MDPAGVACPPMFQWRKPATVASLLRRGCFPLPDIVLPLKRKTRGTIPSPVPLLGCWFFQKKKWTRPDSNQQPTDYESAALPLSYGSIYIFTEKLKYKSPHCSLTKNYEPIFVLQSSNLRRLKSCGYHPPHLKSSPRMGRGMGEGVLSNL